LGWTGFWARREFDTMGEDIKLASFDCGPSMNEIYCNARFDASKIK